MGEQDQAVFSSVSKAGSRYSIPGSVRGQVNATVVAPTSLHVVPPMHLACSVEEQSTSLPFASVCAAGAVVLFAITKYCLWSTLERSLPEAGKLKATAVKAANASAAYVRISHSLTIVVMVVGWCLEASSRASLANHPAPLPFCTSALQAIEVHGGSVSDSRHGGNPCTGSYATSISVDFATSPSRGQASGTGRQAPVVSAVGTSPHRA